MEPEGSLLCSQQPATGPHPEPEESNPHLPKLSRLILSSHLRLPCDSADIHKTSQPN
jgi:hypothetical protein